MKAAHYTAVQIILAHEEGGDAYDIIDRIHGEFCNLTDDEHYEKDRCPLEHAATCTVPQLQTAHLWLDGAS
jgi:hypothetical protein